MKLKYTIILIAFSVTVLILTFITNFDTQLKEFESKAKAKEALVNEYVDLTGNFIDMMTIYGERYLADGKNKDYELYSYLQQNPEENEYNLDLISRTQYKAESGNLTGIGEIPETGIAREEINLALSYGKYFQSFYKRIPDVAWLYYTSENDFINIYPWTYSKNFKYSKMLKSKEFYTYAIPEKNPKADAVWTPLYMDAAGKGLMVTLSSPIYKGNTFMGVISLDLTTRQLCSMIDSEYKSYLIDVKDQVIAAGANTGFYQNVVEFGKLLGISENEKQRIKQLKNGVVQSFGSYYIYHVHFTKTPWTLYFIIPIWTIIIRSLIYTSPIIGICLLLFWTARAVEKRRRTEIKLNETLSEITSYHQLLENSAKHDFLTNTCNRRGLAELFIAHIETRGADTPVSFIMGDIDNFKNFNDTFGHTAGDRILVEIANLMKKNVGEKDVVCRWGGEEFVIMLINKAYEGALSIAEMIRKQIEENVIPWTDTLELKATMTFGVAVHDFNVSMQETISKADSALYIGKEKGRNTVIGYLDINQ